MVASVTCHGHQMVLGKAMTRLFYFQLQKRLSMSSTSRKIKQFIMQAHSWSGSAMIFLSTLLVMLMQVATLTWEQLTRHLKEWQLVEIRLIAIWLANILS